LKTGSRIKLRIESFHPADEATADIARSVAARIEL
jgi:hypothetical protein